jgi:SNF2 family DNA or RNA helicase
MERIKALKDLRELLDKYSLHDWSIRLNQNSKFVGLCSHKDKCIIISAHHIDSHPEPEILNTNRHEVAHALVGPYHAHDEVWQAKAREVGCDNTSPCMSYGLNSEVIDAIRSGADVEISFEEEVIRKPKYQITRLQDKCETCGKVAISKVENTIEMGEYDLRIITLECGHSLVKKISKGTPFHRLYAYEEFEESIKNCKHEFDKNKCNKCGTFRPFAFQVEGMRFIEQSLAINKGAAIFDEMGLGKTIQALGYIKFHPESWPVLYCVKSGILYQWYQQISTWLGPLFSGQILRTSNDFVIPGLRTYLISYDLLIQKVRKSKSGKVIVQGFDPQRLIDAGIKTLVLDECQQIKNPDSSRTQQVRKLARHMNVIALSGTPWKNRGSEFFSVLNMMAPMKFHSFENFKSRWVSYYYDGQYTREGGIRNPNAFKEYIKDIAIRRERTEVMKELPLVNRTKLAVELSELEESEYSDAEGAFVKWYNEQIINGEEPSGMNILAQMSRMRHLTGLSKIPATELFVDEFIENEDKRLVIFVHHQDVGEILFENLSKKLGSERIKRLTGGMDSKSRYEVQEWFNHTEGALLIASTLAAGEGLNLQTCADCIMHEPQWNPQNEEQAEGRFIRIGQTASSVNATYVEADGTIDAHFSGIRERKRRQFHEAMNRGEQPKWDTNEIAKELAMKIVEAYNRKKKTKKSA